MSDVAQACSHASLLDRVKTYRTQIPIFVSEWGSSDYTGSGGVCACAAKDFLDVFSDKDGSGGVTLSMAQWSWCDKDESSAALTPGACVTEDWDSLTESGQFLKDYIQSAAESCGLRAQCGPGAETCACTSGVCCDNGGAPGEYYSCQQDAAVCGGGACPADRDEPCTVVA